jgi:hypothetical protein
MLLPPSLSMIQLHIPHDSHFGLYECYKGLFRLIREEDSLSRILSKWTQGDLKSGELSWCSWQGGGFSSVARHTLPPSSIMGLSRKKAFVLQAAIVRAWLESGFASAECFLWGGHYAPSGIC